jgi:hypothetical protein
MTVERLVEWATAELMTSGLAAEDASTAASYITTAPGDGPILAAVTMVVTARGIARLPEGSLWWTSDAAALPKRRLLSGEPDLAWVSVAERLAEPAEDCWDPNWPSYKVATTMLPEGAAVGDSFVVGNGEGVRARIEVVEHGDRLAAVIAATWGSLDEEWDEAITDAEAIRASR